MGSRPALRPRGGRGVCREEEVFFDRADRRPAETGPARDGRGRRGPPGRDLGTGVLPVEAPVRWDAVGPGPRANASP